MTSDGVQGPVVPDRLQVRFSMWGDAFDPNIVTKTTGVVPESSRRIGDQTRRGPATRAYWKWCSRWGDDERPLLDEMVQTLGPHVTAFAAWSSDGVEVGVTVSGEQYGDLVSSPDEANLLGYYVPVGEPFETYLGGARIGLFLAADVIRFLADAGAFFQTHIDTEIAPRPATSPHGQTS